MISIAQKFRRTPQQTQALNVPPLPPDRVIGTRTKTREIIMEAAIENGASVHELPLEDIGTRVVEPNSLIEGQGSRSSDR